ncbi:helix-turn-helix domain-containing protein [Asanoa sp. NPDC050611]|uniref:winged helix-turn-helix transcriptional regulator n=1 Tax=Asanoa sp. NPDC050611 TaxID=3157098 RepID=UPI0034078D03
MSFDATQSAILCADEDARRHTRDVLRRVGDAWSLVLVSQLTRGPRRFTELLRAVDGISHRMLTQTLRGLQRDGLVSRTSFPEIPPRVEYELTPLGRTLIGPVLELTRWAEDYRDDVEENRRRYDARR